MHGRTFNSNRRRSTPSRAQLAQHQAEELTARHNNERTQQLVTSELGLNITRFNQAVVDYLRTLHLSPTDPKALALLAQQVGQQAAITAIVDVLYFTAWSFVAMLPLVLLLRRRRSALPPLPAME